MAAAGEVIKEINKSRKPTQWMNSENKISQKN